jgi:hypothetical protein
MLFALTSRIGGMRCGTKKEGNRMRMKIITAVILAAGFMTSGTQSKAETYPFLGAWGDETFGKGCGDPASTIVITPDLLEGGKIEKIEKEAEWYVVTTHDDAGGRLKTNLFVEGRILMLQGSTEPEMRTMRFEYVRCD